MYDRLGINMYPVSVIPPPAQQRQMVLQRADVLEREADHLARAARQIRDGINWNQSRVLTEGVLNSRNWMLSVVISHCFLQTALEGAPHDAVPQSAYAGKTGTAAAFAVSEFLVQRAARAGFY